MVQIYSFNISLNYLKLGLSTRLQNNFSKNAVVARCIFKIPTAPIKLITAVACRVVWSFCWVWVGLWNTLKERQIKILNLGVKQTANRIIYKIQKTGSFSFSIKND